MKPRGQGPQADGEVVAGAKNFVLASVGIVTVLTFWWELDIKVTQMVLEGWLQVTPYVITIFSFAPSVFEGLKFNMDPAYEKVKLLQGVVLAGWVCIVFDVITDTIGIHSMVGNIYQLSSVVGTNNATTAFFTNAIEWLISLALGTVIALGPEKVIGGLILLALVHISDFTEAMAMLFESISNGVKGFNVRLGKATGGPRP